MSFVINSILSVIKPVSALKPKPTTVSAPTHKFVVDYNMKPYVKPFINSNLKIVIVGYKFTNKTISTSNFGTVLKNYYENNSRGLVKIVISKFVANIDAPYKKIPADKVADMGMQQIAKKFGANAFDMYVHLVNPKVSHAGNKKAITFASNTNVVHETGHLFGLGHANTAQYDKKGNMQTIHSRDPFDCMTIFQGYPSLNPPHRHQKGWFLPGEEAYGIDGSIYDLAMLKDFSNKTDIKAIYYTHPVTNWKYWISYGTWKGEPKLVFHMTNPTIQFTWIDGFTGIDKNITHERSGVYIEILSHTKSMIKIKFNLIDKFPVASNLEKSNELDDSATLNSIDDASEMSNMFVSENNSTEHDDDSCTYCKVDKEQE